ncbi:MAG: hypothetical protein WCW31_01475 [Patescibacteria group bacterium]
MAYSPETLRELAEAQNIFVWETPEFEYHVRSPYWYLIVSIIALACVAYGVWANNYLFALIIVLIAVILMFAGHDEPRKVLVQIGHNGVVVDGKFVEFDKLANFSIIYQPPLTKILYIERKLSANTRYKLMIEDQDPIAVRSHLLRYLPENLALRDEHFSDILGRLLKI